MLKILNLASNDQTKKLVVENSLALLNNGLMNYSLSEQDKNIDEAYMRILLKFYFMFCCDLLYQEKLITSKGLGQGLINLTMHIG